MQGTEVVEDTVCQQAPLSPSVVFQPKMACFAEQEIRGSCSKQNYRVNAHSSYAKHYA